MTLRAGFPKLSENSRMMDYFITPISFFPSVTFQGAASVNVHFCLVREKEGYIQSVEPVELNPKGKWIEVLDNNFFANPQ